MKLYVGARDIRLPGYKTVDIDPKQNPDFVADMLDMHVIPDASCDEVMATAVLEHVDWPNGFKALAEMTRILKPGGVLKICVPDMGALSRMILNGGSDFHVLALIYGVGGIDNPFEAHRYGYTSGMLLDILQVLGYGKFDWFNNAGIGDATGGWTPRIPTSRLCENMNVAATKILPPLVDPKKLYDALRSDPMGDFSPIAAKLMGVEKPVNGTESLPAMLYQQIHFQLVEAREHIHYTENKPAFRFLRKLGLL